MVPLARVLCSTWAVADAAADEVVPIAAGTVPDADSGAGTVFIVADDRDWPKELDASVGFAPLARRSQLPRPPFGQSSS